MKNQLEIHATLVADEFIDTYMASANGEYVKVYLYMLRHRNEPVELSAIAGRQVRIRSVPSQVRPFR